MEIHLQLVSSVTDSPPIPSCLGVSSGPAHSRYKGFRRRCEISPPSGVSLFTLVLGLPGPLNSFKAPMWLKNKSFQNTSSFQPWSQEHGALVPTQLPSLYQQASSVNANSIHPQPIKPMYPTHKKARKPMPKAVTAISPWLLLSRHLLSKMKPSFPQETSERQKWKTILGPLSSKQVTANCKGLTHTSLPIRLSNKLVQRGPD